MSDPWYDLVDPSTPVTQGDVIPQMPLVGWGGAAIVDPEGSPDELESMIAIMRDDVVVMSQACDIEQAKIENVVLCPVVALSDYHNAWAEDQRSRDQNPTDKAWGSLCDEITNGYRWNLAMLGAGLATPPDSDVEVAYEHRIVDFHDVYSVPLGWLNGFARSRGEPRWRLRPPYREHLSQAFARFFMRVGLPVDVTRPWRDR
jgi:hypothetical protein